MNEGIPEPDPERHGVKLVRDLTRQDIRQAGIVIDDDGSIRVRAEEVKKTIKPSRDKSR
jgi:hypothetical protein